MLNRPVIVEVAKEGIQEIGQPIGGEQFIKLQAGLIKKHNVKVQRSTVRKRKEAMKGMYGR